MSPSLLSGTSLSRRALIAAIPGIGAGAIGAVELHSWYRISGAGADPDEYVPEDCGEETAELVLTTGVRGEPDRTEEIAAERKRRLEVYENVPIARLREEYDGLGEVDGVGMKRRSDNPCDLALVFSVRELGDDHPTAVDGVPIVYEYAVPTWGGEDAQSE